MLLLSEMGIPLSKSHYVVHRGERRLLNYREIPLKGRAAFVAGHAIDVTAMENIQSELSSHITAQDIFGELGDRHRHLWADRRLVL